MKTTKVYSLFILLAVGACATDKAIDESSLSKKDAVQAPSQDVSSYQPSRGLSFVDPKGRTWVWKKRAVFVEDPEEFEKDEKDAQTGPSDEELAKLSDEEFAEIIKPVSLVGEDEYTLASPDIELARAIRAGHVPQGRAPIQGTIKPDEGGDENGKPIDLKKPQQSNVVIDSDDRSPVTTSGITFFPNTATMVMASSSPPLVTGNPAFGCSGAMIGNSTAISAAHCFYNSGVGWYPNKQWALGVSTNGYTSTRATMYTPPGYPCYMVTIPGGFTSSNTIYNDYAVIEFNNGGACQIDPGLTVGGFGWWNASVSQIVNNDSTLYGYTGTPPSWWATGYPWPTLYKSTTSWVTVGSPSYVIYHEHDTVGGDSGAPLGQKIFSSSGDNTVYITAIHKGQSSSTANWARKIDPTVIGFVQTYSAL